MLSDIEISHKAKIRHIRDIARKLEIDESCIEYYGSYKAKLNSSLWGRIENNRSGKLILVTAINPTPAGEGKTTTSIGLCDALNNLGHKTCVVLREPSLGPCFGSKGTATGGGYAQVIPMEDINLHFTGDIHAITCAHNLLAALIDNHIYNGNQLNFDLKKITWNRVLDVNDRSLRNIVIGLGRRINGIVRESGFDISVASEIMAVICLSSNIAELRERIGEMILGYTSQNTPITCEMLKATGAVVALLNDALKPNLVQTIGGSPAIIHGGPFANIAHGCNSLIATRYALKLADYVVTEAGFGSDLGAEKFLDIKCPLLEKVPDVVVVVATIRALKMHGYVAKKDLNEENLKALENGFENLRKHIQNIQRYNIRPIVALNVFESDTENEIELVRNKCSEIGVKVELSNVWAMGGNGALDLGRTVVNLANENNAKFSPLYNIDDPINVKIEKIACMIYGADSVYFSAKAKEFLRNHETCNYPICIAKTEKSLSDDKTALGRPTGFKITINDMKVMAGAKMIVAYAGDIMTMPGFPKTPRAMQVDITDDGIISGLS